MNNVLDPTILVFIWEEVKAAETVAVSRSLAFGSYRSSFPRPSSSAREKRIGDLVLMWALVASHKVVGHPSEILLPFPAPEELGGGQR